MSRKFDSSIQEPNEADLIVNFQMDKVGAQTGRMGYSQFGTVSTGGDISGMCPYYQTNGTDGLIVSSGTKLYIADSNTTLSSALLNNSKIEMEPFLDQLFIVGSYGNTFMSPLNLSNTTVSTTVNLSDAPAAKYAKVYKDQMYFINVYSGGGTYNSRFWRSSVPSAGAITWAVSDITNAGWEDVNPDDNEELMGGAVNSNRLLLFKETRLFVWDLTQIVHVADVGTTSHKSIATKDGLTFFINRSGIYAFAYGAGVKRVSDKGFYDIFKTLTTTQLANAVGHITEDHYRCFVGDLTIDGMTFTNCEFDYKISTNTMTINSYYNEMTSTCPYTTASYDRVYYGTSAGEIMKRADGSDTQYSDDGHDISCLFRSPYLDFDLPEQKKFIGAVYPLVNSGMGMKWRLRADSKDWHSNTLKDKHDKLSIFPQEGYAYQYEVSVISQNKPSSFSGIVFETKQATDEK